MRGMLGTQQQVPPAFSAKRVEGRRSYQLARAGKPVAPKAVVVTVFAFDCVDWTPPMLEFRAEVSAGTYVRTLGRDLGDRLGLGGHLTGLRREAIGAWRVEDAVAPEALGPGMALIPPAALLPGMPEVPLSSDEAVGVSHGRSVPREGALGHARLMHEGRLVAIGEAIPEGWHPMVVLEGA